MSDSCDRKKCKKKCVYSIEEERRKEINNNYWNLRWIERKTFILNSISRSNVKRRTTNELNPVKQNSIKYFFKDSKGEKHNVCKFFF